MAENKGVTPQREDYARWYTDVVKMADLAENAPVRGCMIIKPYGYELWEHIKAALDIRFKAQFCYIDVYQEPPEPDQDWSPAWSETREEYIERLRNTPLHLCRLRYFGDDRWGYAFYTYSHDKYELTVYPDGDFSASQRRLFWRRPDYT